MILEPYGVDDWRAAGAVRQDEDETEVLVERRER